MKYRIDWIKRIWHHYFKAKKSYRYQRTYFIDCLIGSLALLLNLESDSDIYSIDFKELAWIKRGYIHTDYGTGEAWETCGIYGLSYRIWEDSSI